MNSIYHPKVTVVTPSYNQVLFLEKTIQSVLNQTYSNIEYLVIDGGSNDGSLEVIQKYQDQLAYWISETDQGQAHAIQKGFQKATGEIFAYLNSDDLWKEDTVEIAVRYFLKHPEKDMVCGNRIVINESGQIRYYRPWLGWGLKSPYIYFLITQESVFWKKTLYEKVNGINLNFQFALDYDLFSRMIQQGGQVGWEPKLWAYFRKHTHSKTMSLFKTIGFQEVKKIQKQTFGFVQPQWKHVVYFFMYRITYVFYSIFCRPKNR